MNKRLLSLLLLLQVLSAAAQMPASAPPRHPADSAGGPSDMILQTDKGNVYGTLAIPDTKQKMPVVLIIAGSGPVDRNGNVRGMESNVYHMLADSLLQHGIASLRYDKRGIGQSAAAMRSESDMTFRDMIGDAIGWIRLLKADGRFSRVIVLGHSEGSLIGMVAAKEANADAYISVSGAGDRIDKIIETQLRARAPREVDKATLLLDSLSKGYKVQEPGGNLNGLFRASIQPYMISWIRYDPRKEIKILKIPILILQGATDIQVSVEDARALKEAQPAATLVVVEGMNHVLKPAPADPQQNIATYNAPGLSLKPELVTAIDEFILH